MKIRRGVLDWSAYQAAAAAPRLRLDISVAIDPIGFRNQNLESIEKNVFFVIFSPGPMKLCYMIIHISLKPYSFKTIGWTDMKLKISVHNDSPQHRRLFDRFDFSF